MAEHAIYFWTHSENTIVEQNLILNYDRGIGLGLRDVPHVNGTIRNADEYVVSFVVPQIHMLLSGHKRKNSQYSKEKP